MENSEFDDTYNETILLIQRTDSNRQVFNLTMEESINFLRVENHYITFYDSYDQVSIRDGDEYVNFTSHPNTSTVLETDSLVIYDQTTKPISVKADPLKIIEIGKIIVRRILGIGIQYED